MPFSTTRHHWYSLGLLLALLASGLSGCSTPAKKETGLLADDESTAELVELFEGFDTQTVAPAETPDETQSIEPLQLDEEGELELIAAQGEAEIPEPTFLSPVNIAAWDVVVAGAVGNAVTGVADTHFVRPMAISARGEYLYVVDAGQDAVLRYDMVSHRLEAVLDLRGAVSGEVADIYVNPDFSFYLTDTDASRVLFFDRDGDLMQIFKNYLNLAKPVAVAVLDAGDIVVADGHYDHLVRFNAAGTMIATYGGRGLESGEFLNIMTMAAGPDGFYVGTRVGRHLQVVGADGRYRYSFEEGKVVFPTAIAVDDMNRSYVADGMDNTIKIFDRGRLVTTIGSGGNAPGQFMNITDLWLDGQFLYVVDSLNRRIQIGHLLPE